MIALSRVAIISLAVLFSVYHVVLGLSALGIPLSPWPTVASLVAFAAAITLSLLRPRTRVLRVWIAAFDLAVSIAIPLAVTSQLAPDANNGYATWYVAAVGTLLTIVMVRGRDVWAWVGIGFLALYTIWWAGLDALGDLGVVGSVVWVVAANVVMYAVTKTAEDAERFAEVERKASEWRAAYDAHVVERQHRLEHTYTMAEPLLTEIVRSGGELSDAQRSECLLLEATMRDEIRGRGLLNDEVRSVVTAARRRGAAVSLLDEGGLDELDAARRESVLTRLADALDGADADTLIVRTVPRAEDVAVTVVGLKAAEDGDDESDVTLWLEIKG
ncbi:hypothetical protein [Gryllotalpicola protaetiae]|uniref:Uncharacterized protein n=1 Tax=Gryllotalpicola protaetiae TaxID=2419771 RepID=A0A387BTJ0_9MICO|nr:hypothetical protein [Gryllotalpicola protaetiae]AYG04257.1 hypothetical protein D7I44_12445 [Gryllotalpicola protaetiae]